MLSTTPQSYVETGKLRRVKSMKSMRNKKTWKAITIAKYKKLAPVAIKLRAVSVTYLC